MTEPLPEGFLRDQIAEALSAWVLKAAGGKPPIMQPDADALRENSLARAGAIMAVVQTELDAKDADAAFRLKQARDNGKHWKGRTGYWRTRAEKAEAERDVVTFQLDERQVDLDHERHLREEERDDYANRLRAVDRSWTDLAAERDQLREALELIGTKCEAFTGPSTCVDDPSRSPDADYLAFRWCDRCIARTALAGQTASLDQGAEETPCECQPDAEIPDYGCPLHDHAIREQQAIKAIVTALGHMGMRATEAMARAAIGGALDFTDHEKAHAKLDAHFKDAATWTEEPT